MRISLKWLRDYIDIAISPSELANLLTMSGNEVKALETIGSGWGDKVVIGKIAAVRPHPQADRLRLVTVDLGKEEHTVVCGAPNLNLGDKVVFAAAGARLKDGHSGKMMELKPAVIRGVKSAGMICSEMELGISDEHNVILVLPVEAPIGMTLLEYLGDTILDLDVTPNRPDCLSVIGIGREAAALTGQAMHIPDVKYTEAGAPISEKMAVEILDSDLCPRYSASLITHVQIKPSPRWMQERLIAGGMRPINNIVDISNYVMLEYGQPLHTFDYDKIIDKKIIVRRAVLGENLVSLDGVDRKLTPDMLVIADPERAIAIAGVMGGANSDVTEQTTSILVEAANFNPVNIRKTGDALNLSSEARYRFERGISAGITMDALKRATQLIAELGDGNIAKGVIDVFPGKKSVEPLILSSKRLRKFLGADFSMEEISGVLTSLGFDCRGMSSSDIQVIAPYWRSDIHIEVDLIEEVARVLGYDRIPNTLLAEALPQQNPDPIFILKRNVRQSLSSLGFTEVLNFSFVGLDMLRTLLPDNERIDPTPLRIANPMTADMEYLRTNFRYNLLSAFAANRRYEDSTIRLFELGKIYLPGNMDSEGFDERYIACCVAGGQRFARSWQDNDQVLDFFDAKGFMENLFLRFGLTPQFKNAKDVSLHPNKQAEVLLNEKLIGLIGEVHPRILAAFDIAESVYLLEIDLTTLVQLVAAKKMYQPIPRFPAIVRDIALTVNMSITHEKVVEIIRKFPLVDKIAIFDVYSGEQVLPNKKSLAYHISYRSPNHTLTDDEVNRVQQQVVDRLNSEIGAVMRS